MNIYLNDKNIDGYLYSTSKSGGKVTSSFYAAPFTIFHFYIKTGFSIKFLLPYFRSLPNIFILDLLSSKSLALLISILFTQRKTKTFNSLSAAQSSGFYLQCLRTIDKTHTITCSPKIFSEVIKRNYIPTRAQKTFLFLTFLEIANLYFSVKMLLLKTR